MRARGRSSCDQRLCHASGLGLAAKAIPDKANETTAIPGLLAQLDLAGAVVTMDAMGGQKNIAKAIVDQQADYVLALKENPPILYDDIRLWLDDNDAQGYVRVHETVEKDHGRIETRRTVVSIDSIGSRRRGNGLDCRQWQWWNRHETSAAKSVTSGATIFVR